MFVKLSELTLERKLIKLLVSMTFSLVVISALTLNAFAALIFLLVRLMPMKKLGLLIMWVVGTPVIIWKLALYQKMLKTVYRNT